MAFGLAVVDLIEKIKASARGQPPLPTELPPAVKTFRSEGWHTSDVWMFSDLAPVYRYLRGNSSLHIPGEWRRLVPKELR